MESGSCVSAWVGLGSNLGDSAAVLQDALDALGRIFGVELTAVSSVYQSAPVGLSAQPDFLNAVARIDTSLEPGELLEQLLRIETEQGRVRLGERFGPRLIDLDLLLYNETMLQSDALTLPHPRMLERRFVLEPLAELEGDMVLPGGRRLCDCLGACFDQRLDKIGSLRFVSHC
ncbi:MAG: 2-amino-4-hydroxy-6-hydroxymethyldihydropteridine diphosphokinase [Acidiferrobacteraceae bacterium]|nr:2-amino-4-hydroxy-6-hydroxymethyldihydropteridine diphosphokinase [Acidiferrobacteraceae bacterium]MBT4396088.1 2-amino-4-hydroxy-6-hydroxymethyldihydropteridine diphosphokinase [Acidiferrobacteraceae bacterium]MBT4808225.1 2-amino-4-hydroxy-6-hydroxymethyldihydropteridine diphosphokinase [Acidiferrobacteraceae bacterium]MBT5343321.1 2-amino-4-hydroxy-6-hydroxymethyldihydropteridine diphosphokinase [Acidiferrobacteraceae bacterium]MBT5623414.1 2-amino-4-hydroxy-6-hydroxymethyldihydropteridin